MKQNLDLDNASPQNRGQRVQRIRKQLLGLSRNAFCEGADFQPGGLKVWELGWAGGLTDKGAHKLVKHLKKLNVYCSVPWLMSGVGTEPQFRSHSLNTNEQEDTDIAEEIALFKKHGNAIEAQVTDDSMIPILYPGNYVAGIILDDIDKAMNKECIIVTPTGDTFIRKLTYGDGPGQYHLRSLNEHSAIAQPVIENVQIAMIAPILWIRRRNTLA